MNREPLAPDAPWIVLKFGGTSVSARSRWLTIAELMRKRLQDERVRVLTVVSALSGVTDLLSALCQTGEDLDARAARVQSIRKRHLDFVAELELDAVPQLDKHLGQLDALSMDDRALSRDFAWQAEVLALGELCSSAIGAALLGSLDEPVPLVLLDSRDHLQAAPQPSASAWAQHLSVNCVVDHGSDTRELLAQRGELFLAQGFIARTAQGQTAILGRGGSDTSASYFGALLGALRVEIWTDVPGMFSANPRLIPQARLLKSLDYDEAQEIATTGAKVLHPRCLGPVREAGVPLWIKDTQRPGLAGTVISAQTGESPPSVKALSWRSNITLIAMESLGMWQQVGFLADVFAAFKRHGLSVDLIGSSETNVTVSLDPSDNLLDSDTLQRLCADLALVCRVKVIAPCAAVTLVGRGMRRLMHRLHSVFAEVGSERVHLLTQSANDLNLTFVVDESALAPLLPRLHAALLSSGLLCGEDPRVLGPSWTELSGASAIRPPQWWREPALRERLLALAGQGPVHVYQLADIRQRTQALQSIAPIGRWFYALKANSHPQVLQTLVQAGFGLECVSLGELQRARTLVDAASALFTPNFASRQEYAQALQLGCMLTLDNLYPLRAWPELFADRELLLRVDLGIGRGHHDKVRTGGARSKFGIDPAELAEARERVQAAGASIIGLHAHLGSGIADARHWSEVGAQLVALADAFPTVRILNLGGGLGVPARASDPELDLQALASELERVRQLAPQYQLWMEPGRYPVAAAGVLLARVTQTKHKSGVDFVGVETGMNSLLRPALYDAWHEIVNLSRLDDAAIRRFDVVGPICESGDVLGRERDLPQCLEGDVLLIAQTGAYGATMASAYNLRAAATEVVL